MRASIRQERAVSDELRKTSRREGKAREATKSGMVFGHTIAMADMQSHERQQSFARGYSLALAHVDTSAGRAAPASGNTGDAPGGVS